MNTGVPGCLKRREEGIVEYSSSSANSYSVSSQGVFVSSGFGFPCNEITLTLHVSEAMTLHVSGQLELDIGILQDESPKL